MRDRSDLWEAARRRGLAALVQLCTAYEAGTDRAPAMREFERAALDLALVDSGWDPTAEPWDPERSRQLDLELVVGERARR